MGDNREEINLEKGVWKCNYALVVISKFTVDSVCAMEELSIIESKYRQSLSFQWYMNYHQMIFRTGCVGLKNLSLKKWIDIPVLVKYAVISYAKLRETSWIIAFIKKCEILSPHLKKFCHLGCMTSSVVIYKLIMQILTAESLYFMQHTWLLLIQKE